jgi:hypothetical protein
MPDHGLADVLHHTLLSFYVEAFDRTSVATAIGSFSDLTTSMGDGAFTRDLVANISVIDTLTDSAHQGGG